MDSTMHRAFLRLREYLKTGHVDKFKDEEEHLRACRWQARKAAKEFGVNWEDLEDYVIEIVEAYEANIANT